MKQELSHTEKMYLENQEYEKKNVEEVKKPKLKKAEVFRKEHGYSLTMSKLMKKWNCSSVEEYRAIRKKHKKENYVGPRKEKKKKEIEPSPWQRNDRSNFNKRRR